MAKWMLIQKYPSMPIEVWEYIDDLKKAMKYWYVANVIRKYGVEKTMPIVMNDYGGFCTHRPNAEDVVAIIESDKKPQLSVFQQYPVNNKHFETGWLSPEGATFSCQFMGHIRLAMDLCRCIYEMPENNLADDILLGKGWVKVMHGKWFGDWDKITKEQASVIEQKGFTRF